MDNRLRITIPTIPLSSAGQHFLPGHAIVEFIPVNMIVLPKQGTDSGDSREITKQS